MNNPAHSIAVLNCGGNANRPELSRTVPYRAVPNRTVPCSGKVPIVSNQGPQFTSRVWSAFCLKLNINVSLTSGYHPQANGQVERLNQELTHFLRSYCHRNQADWSCYIIWAEYAQNSLRKPATGLNPFQCVLGFQPPLFSWSGEPSDLPAINSWLQRIERISNGQSGEQGSWLIVDGVPIPTTIRVNGSGYRPVINVLATLQKTQSQVRGFKILRQITPVSFRLALPANYRISPTFHVSLLKPAGGSRGVEDQEEAGDQRAPPIIIDGEEVYRVQEVLCSSRRGRVVDWEGFGPEERSWVNAEDILDPSITTDVHRTHLDKSAQRPRGRPRRRRGGGGGGGGGCSVTNQFSVTSSDHHQRAPSPEY